LIVGVAALCVVDLWRVDLRIGHRLPAAVAAPVPARLAELALRDPGPGRILPLGPLFMDNRWAASGISSAGGYHAAKPRAYQDLVDITRLGEVSAAGRLAARSGLRDLLNIRYVVSPVPLHEPGLVLRETVLLDAGGRYLPLYAYENPTALPRAFVVGDFVLARSAPEALYQLASPAFDPRRAAVLEKPPSPAPRADPTGSAELISYRPENVSVRTRSAAPQLLVLTDLFYPPGWTAWVDGRPVETLRAYHAFRAVALPPGQHQVEFHFSSRAYEVGRWVTGAALAAATALLLVGVVTTARRARC
jgi:hypothetical protein